MVTKMGKNWKDIPVVEATIEDINNEAIKIFKEKAIKSKRLRKEDLDIDNETLLSNLNLYDGKYLTRAAILLFAKNPEKWLVGSYIKIGFFERNDADLRYQDEVHGSIIIQVDKVMELMYTKYQKALITYEGVQRIEEFIFPYEAFRELLLNSINHKAYESKNPIQISVYDDKYIYGMMDISQKK